MKKNVTLSRNDSIVYDVNNHNWINESINRLKDNILSYGLDKNHKVIQIESSVSSEAKTTTVCNLAVALGYSGKKTIVVDLDFRKPRAHRPFHIENVEGIADYLLDKVDISKVIKKTTYDNVYLANRGTDIQSSSFILTSEKMKAFIDDLRKDFDFILLDCPPVLVISDYIHISRFADGVLFNVAFGKTKKNQVIEAINLIKKNNIPLIGAVYTFYQPENVYNKNEYYGYGKYYNSTYGDENER